MNEILAEFGPPLATAVFSAAIVALGRSRNRRAQQAAQFLEDMRRPKCRICGHDLSDVCETCK